MPTLAPVESPEEPDELAGVFVDVLVAAAVVVVAVLPVVVAVFVAGVVGEIELKSLDCHRI